MEFFRFVQISRVAGILQNDIMEIRNEFQIAERDFAQSSVVLSDNRQRRHLQTGKEFMLPLSSNENELKYEIKERRVPALVAIGYEECSRWRWEPPE